MGRYLAQRLLLFVLHKVRIHVQQGLPGAVHGGTGYMGYTIQRLAMVVTGVLLASSAFAAPQAQGETFVATASVKTQTGSVATAPVTVVITRPTTEAERSTVGAALKKGGTAAVVAALKAMPDAGYIEVGGRRTTLKYAFVRPMAGGRMVTVVAPTPIVHLGAGLPDAPSKAGFDLALALLLVQTEGEGTGELVPAGTVKINVNGAIETQDYASEIVRLSKVVVKK